MAKFDKFSDLVYNMTRNHKSFLYLRLQLIENKINAQNTLLNIFKEFTNEAGKVITDFNFSLIKNTGWSSKRATENWIQKETSLGRNTSNIMYIQDENKKENYFLCLSEKT